MKRKDTKISEMRPHYDFTNAVRGKYHARYRQGSSVRVISSKTITCTLTFNATARVDTAQVGDLLFLLRGAYAAGLDSLEVPRTDLPPRLNADVTEVVHGYLRRLDVSGIDSLFTRDLGTQSLVTRQVSMNSPLTVTFEGATQGLIAAVCLAGGELAKLQPPSSQINLPPVLAAIQSLREALVPGIRAPLGYGIRSRHVQLSRAELRELMKHDPSSKHRGGFQRLLVNLQQRVDKRTGELDLFEPEMTTIMRNGRNPSKGGWQASLHRIFGRHFDMLD
jgi:hypothetical protein